MAFYMAFHIHCNNDATSIKLKTKKNINSKIKSKTSDELDFEETRPLDAAQSIKQ